MKEQFTNVFARKKKRGFVGVVAVMLAVLAAGVFVGFTMEKDSDAPAIENINFSVTDCNVIIKTSSLNVINSSSNDEIRYELDEEIHELTTTWSGSTVNIALISTGNPKKNDADTAIIFIPEGHYNKITVVGTRAGVSLPSLNADCSIINQNGATSISVSKDFNKTIDFTSVDGSCSLVLSPSADNYTLNMAAKTSAVSIPESFPEYKQQPEYEYVKGTGAAKIALKLEGSACSVVVSDKIDKRMQTFTIKDKLYYLVNNEEHLRLIGSESYPLSENYMLSSNIDLEKPWIPLGNNDDAPFTGRFNGNGFIIRNVSIDDQKGEYKYLGFFGLVKGGTIHNIALENVSIKAVKRTDAIIAPKGSVAAVILNGEMTDCTAT